MTEIKTLTKILQNHELCISKTKLSYLENLLPELQNQQIILFHNIDYVESNKFNTSTCSEITAKKELDVTGSPLQHSFGDESFNLSIIDKKCLWCKEEESHLPIERIDVCHAINLCLNNLDDSWKLPIFGLCNIKSDINRTVLIGTIPKCGWFNTVHICEVGLDKISNIKAKLPLLKKEHLKESKVPEKDIRISTYCSYDLFGTSKRKVNWDQIKKCKYEGCLRLETEWESLSFKPPLGASRSNLNIEVAIGREGSLLERCWRELLMLDEYLNTLENYLSKNKDVRRSERFTLPSTSSIEQDEKIIEDIHLLLTGYDEAGKSFYVNEDLNDGLNVDDLDNSFKSQYYFEELTKRQNLDFTELLWQLLSECKNYKIIESCMHQIFEELVKCEYRPEIHESNPTKLAEILNDLILERATRPLTSGSLSMELLIDIGIEKLSRDYAHIILGANLMEQQKLEELLGARSSREFEPLKYRRKLQNLVKLHICLEFVILTHTQLVYPSESSRNLFALALRTFTSPESVVKSFQNLRENPIFDLKVPAHNSIVKQITERCPSTLRFALSSTQLAMSKVTTAWYYSLDPIFPPRIFDEFAENTADETMKEESYYSAFTVSSCFKI